MEEGLIERKRERRLAEGAPSLREKAEAKAAPRGVGLSLHRLFTTPGEAVFETVEWERRDIAIDGGKFTMTGVEIPSSWSETAGKIVASRYLRSRVDSEGRPSVRVLIAEVVDTFLRWGQAGHYFHDWASVEAFADELTYILLHQYAAFNSPVWFNLGIPGVKQQGSACFINPAEDTLEGWIDLVKRETRIFKGGSGAGVNLSPIRSSWEHLSGGGDASGPISLMETLDTNAKQIKSGGRTRRAAKMVTLNVEHPDLLWRKDGTPGFVNCKADAERLAHQLIDLGYDPMFNRPGGAYDRVGFQNANHSVNAGDDFMRAVAADLPWQTRAVTTGQPVQQFASARQIWEEVNAAAWLCGDPGWQFRDPMNRWNTCPNSFYIWATNPCSEYDWDSDTSCNLASLRLTKFLMWVAAAVAGEPDVAGFDTRAFVHVVSVMITAMEILVGAADYPTPEIAAKTHLYRTLGLGPADLGALLLRLGVPYDSNAGRGLAATIQSLMTAAAYDQSAEISRCCGGPFAAYAANREPMLAVLGMHHQEHRTMASHAAGIDLTHPVAAGLYRSGNEMWERARDHGAAVGFRNAQVTLCAPTGTISFLMDCDTTGIEPDIALLKYKTLVGGGCVQYVNRSVGPALAALGYADGERTQLAGYAERHGHLEGSGLAEAHLPVFDCALKAAAATRVITPEGHVKMLGALQPFVSMAISKTVNCPESFTPADMGRIYWLAWELGVKCIALYRDNCKRSQPLSTSPAAISGAKATLAADIPPLTPAAPLPEHAALIELLEPVGVAEDHGPVGTVIRLLEERYGYESLVPDPPAVPEARVERPRREKLLRERASVTHKFDIAGFEGYAIVGCYPDGRPGELFIVASKQGSTICGLLDSFATAISLGLQHGVPLAAFTAKFKNARFEPMGFTDNPELRMAKSIVDYLMRWMEARFAPALQAPRDFTQSEAAGAPPPPVTGVSLPPGVSLRAGVSLLTAPPSALRGEMSGPPCSHCGGLTQPAGRCLICVECGETSGCS